MRTIIVADDADAVIEVRRAAELAGVEVTSIAGTSPAAAAEAIGAAAGSDQAWTVVLAGPISTAAIDIVAEHGGASGLAALSSRFRAEQVDLIREWPELPLLSVAQADDRAGLRSAVDAYLASDHARSELLVSDTTDSEAVASWLVSRMHERIDVADVTCTSDDGWEIHGTMCIPPRSHPVPGVVLLHTGRSDRSAYARLQRLLAEHGLAVYNVDWRGRGASTNLGTYFDLDDATKFGAWRDAVAALERLGSDPRVDADRLAAVGCVHGAEYAVRAAWRDRRVKALVILTGYRPHEPQEDELLVSGEVDVLYVNATGHTITGAAMHDLCRRAPRGRAQLVEYPGSALGYQLFEIDPDLEPRIAAWLSQVLS
jgi:dienelactone hydrolase